MEATISRTSGERLASDSTASLSARYKPVRLCARSSLTDVRHRGRHSKRAGHCVAGNFKPSALLIARFRGDVEELTRAYDRAHKVIMEAGGPPGELRHHCAVERYISSGYGSPRSFSGPASPATTSKESSPKPGFLPQTTLRLRSCTCTRSNHRCSSEVFVGVVSHRGHCVEVVRVLQAGQGKDLPGPLVNEGAPPTDELAGVVDVNDQLAPAVDEKPRRLVLLAVVGDRVFAGLP
ncbi:hypothetical protein QF036_002308 [Arthrobacter globiformis]|nr:hypothetical protein [Arthrobacter globiformis]